MNASRSLVSVQRELEILPFGRSILLRDPTDPASGYYNRVKGFGSPDLPELDKLLEHYPKAAPSFELTPDHMTEDVTLALGGKGFLPVEQLVYMYTSPKSGGEPVMPYPVERVTPDSAEEFISWIAQSAGEMEISAEMLARSKPFFYRPDFINYMLRISGEPAAMGSLFLHGEAGYIANDYTYPKYRGRGCQKALLVQRLADAARLGAQAVYTDVMYGSTSHANMVKAGFQISHINTFWVKQ